MAVAKRAIGPPGPRREPKQARSRELVRAIAQACERILREEGPEAVNTNRIADVAGVNVGSLYRYFPNKEAIVAEVFEEQLRAQAAEYEALLASAGGRPAPTLEEALRLCVQANADMHVRFLGLYESFYREHQKALDLGDRRSDEGTTWLEHVARWLAGVLRAQGYAEGADERAYIVTRAIAGVLRHAARERPKRLGEAAFRDELVALGRAYLSPPSKT